MTKLIDTAIEVPYKLTITYRMPGRIAGGATKFVRLSNIKDASVALGQAIDWYVKQGATIEGFTCEINR